MKTSPDLSATSAIAVPPLHSPKRRMGGRILAAALALPGVVVPLAAHAEGAPEKGVIGVKMLQYQDGQPGLSRIKVSAPSIYALAPINSQWAVEGSLVHDEVSGASPRYHTEVSGASRMHDDRTAFDAKLTRYFSRASVGVGVALSGEHDYKSKAVSIDGRYASADNNTTWNAGLGISNDRINPTGQPQINESKRTTDLMVGVTQALSKSDLLQANLTFGRGTGYFSDPYKLFDNRPRSRNTQIALLRWNHHAAGVGGSWRNSYRYYQDTFGIRAHTFETAWVQSINAQWSVTPSLRYYSQKAASFYYDASGTGLGPVGSPTYSSADQRLSAFGGVTAGLKVDWQINAKWHADAKVEHYEQRGDWRLGGNGSPGLAKFSANWVQLGVSSAF